MTKVMVFNFKTMQFEQASEEDGSDFLSLIDAMNSDCAAQQPRAVDVACACPQPKLRWKESSGWYCGVCYKSPRN